MTADATGRGVFFFKSSSGFLRLGRGMPEGQSASVTADIGVFGRCEIDQADLDAIAVAERANFAASSVGDAGQEEVEQEGIRIVVNEEVAESQGKDGAGEGGRVDSVSRSTSFRGWLSHGSRLKNDLQNLLILPLRRATSAEGTWSKGSSNDSRSKLAQGKKKTASIDSLVADCNRAKESGTPDSNGRCPGPSAWGSSMSGTRKRRPSHTGLHDKVKLQMFSLAGHKLKVPLRGLIHQNTLNPDFRKSASRAKIETGRTTTGAVELTSSERLMRKASIGASIHQFQSAFHLHIQDADDMTEADVEDGDKGGQLLVVYLLTLATLALTFLDVFTGLAYQIFGMRGDFLCGMPEDANSKPVIRFHIKVLAVILGVGHTIHIIRLFRQARQQVSKRQGSQIGVSKGRQFLVKFIRILSLSGFFIWSVILYIFSFVMVALHTTSCKYQETFTCSSLSFSFDLILGNNMIDRFHLLVHLLRAGTLIVYCLKICRRFKKDIQSAVSQNRRRYYESDLKIDLDLTYICDRVIAMSLPCVGDAVYRNDITEVSRFFATKHYGRFLIFNLCEAHEEAGNGNYDCSLLYNQVVKLPMRDHNAPPLHWLVQFVEHAATWLDQSPTHVVGIHCKGGKGRTGMFISSLMIWTFFCNTGSNGALSYFAKRRTKSRGKMKASNMQAVTAPCQQRYVNYIERITRTPGLDHIDAPFVVITKVVMMTLPNQKLSSLNLQMVIETGGASRMMSVVHDHCVHTQGMVRLDKSPSEPENDVYEFDVGMVLVSGDVTIRFYSFPDDVDIKAAHECCQVKLDEGGQSCTCMGMRGKQICFVSFHTAFHQHDSIEFDKSQVDRVWSKSDNVVLPNFMLEVVAESPITIATKAKSLSEPFITEESASKAGLVEEVLTEQTEHPLVSRPSSTVVAPASIKLESRMSLDANDCAGIDDGEVNILFPDSLASLRMDDAYIPKTTRSRESHSWQSASSVFPQLQNSSNSNSLESVRSSEGKFSPLNGRRLGSSSAANMSSLPPEPLSAKSKSAELISSPEEDDSVPSSCSQPQLARHSSSSSQEGNFSPVSRRMPRRSLTVGVLPLSGAALSTDSTCSPESKSPITSPWSALKGVGKSPVSSPPAAAKGRSPPSSPRAQVSHFLKATRKQISRINVWKTCSMDMDKTAKIYQGSYDIYDQVPDNIEPLCRIYHSARMETLEAIKKIPGVEHKVVTKGSKVFASRQGCDGTTCTLITKGTCKWASPDDEMCHQSLVDMNSRKGWGVRCGVFVGIFEFLVGDSIAQDKALHLLASSAEVHSARIRLFEGSDHRVPPAMLPNLSAKESCSFWMLIAKQACDNMRHIEISSEVASKQSVVKVHSHYDASPLHYHQLLDDIRRHFDIKSSEVIVASEVCDRVIFDDSTGASSYVPGRMVITSNWVLWQATSKKEDEAQWDMSLNILHVESVEINGNLLDFDIGQDLLSGEPRQRPQQEMPPESSQGESDGANFDGPSTPPLTSDLASAACNPNVEGSGPLCRNANDKGPAKESPSRRNPGLSEPASEEDCAEPSRQGDTTESSREGESIGQGEEDQTVVSVQFRFASSVQCIEMFGTIEQVSSSKNLKRIRAPKALPPVKKECGASPSDFGYEIKDLDEGRNDLITQLFRTAVRVKYSKGAVIYNPETDAPNLKMYHLLSGFAADTNKFDLAVETYGPGSICGIKHLLFDGNIGQSAMLVARSDVEMLEFEVPFTHDEFYNLLKAQPAAGTRFYRAIALSCFSNIELSRQSKTVRQSLGRHSSFNYVSNVNVSNLKSKSVDFSAPAKGFRISKTLSTGKNY